MCHHLTCATNKYNKNVQTKNNKTCAITMVSTMPQYIN